MPAQSSLIHADTYYATSQAVSDAIDRSISHQEIVTIRTGRHYEAVCMWLAEACEDSVVASGSLTEFWGRNDDGDAWRVHVCNRA